MQDATKGNNCYQRYQELGGIINEKDYESALTRARHATTIASTLIKQSERIACFAGIELQNAEDAIDKRTLLYGVLRTDNKAKETKHHHSQMSDQRLFAEALRMLGDVESLQQLIRAYPNISFD